MRITDMSRTLMTCLLLSACVSGGSSTVADNFAGTADLRHGIAGAGAHDSNNDGSQQFAGGSGATAAGSLRWAPAMGLVPLRLASNPSGRPVGAPAANDGASALRWAGSRPLVPMRLSLSATRPRMTIIRPTLRVASSYGVVPQPRLAHKPVAAQQAARSVRQWCRALAERLPAVVFGRCIDKGFVATGYHSVQGRPLVVRTVQSRQRPARARILLIGGTHGDELSSVSLVFEWLDRLLANGSDYTWHVVPALNPDGLLTDKPTRVNAHGVDLNRNLPTIAWRSESRRYWRRVGYAPRRYPGSAPASEPETQWLVDQIAAFRPDVIVSVHAPYGVLDYNGKFPAPRELGSLELHRLGVYPGSLGNYASRMLGIPVITIELRHARKLPAPAEIRQMWIDLNRWLTRYVGYLYRARARPGDDGFGSARAAAREVIGAAGVGIQRKAAIIRGLPGQPALPTRRGRSSVGRASRSQCEGRRFEPARLHHLPQVCRPNALSTGRLWFSTGGYSAKLVAVSEHRPECVPGC